MVAKKKAVNKRAKKDKVNADSVPDQTTIEAFIAAEPSTDTAKTDSGESSEIPSEEKSVPELPKEESSPAVEAPELLPEASEEPDAGGAEPELPEQEKIQTAERSLPSAYMTGSKKKLKWALALGLIVALAAAGGYYLRPAYDPLPKTVKQKAKFALYYPQATDYKYVAGSESYTGGKLTYELGSANTTTGGGAYIRVSEQPLSGQGPDLNSLPNFSVFQVSAGKAAVGTNEGVANGILVTKKTVIILNGLGGATRQDLVQTIKSMKA